MYLPSILLQGKGQPLLQFLFRESLKAQKQVTTM